MMYFKFYEVLHTCLASLPEILALLIICKIKHSKSARAENPQIIGGETCNLITLLDYSPNDSKCLSRRLMRYINYCQYIPNLYFKE